jgi:hypothetical protein
MENQTSLNLSLPKEKQAVTLAVTNIYVGLDKANTKGVFNLKEAGQLSKDLELIAQILDQVIKLYDNADTNVDTNANK